MSEKLYKFTGYVNIDVDKKLSKAKLIKYLEELCVLDLDTEEAGVPDNFEVLGIELNWASLELSK